MEKHSGDPLEKLPDAVQQWAEELLDELGPNDDSPGVVNGFGLGKNGSEESCCQVYITPESDVSDQELFPREVAGMPVEYIEGGPFEAYGAQAEAA